MPDDGHTPATAVASYALWWGMMTTLASKGILSQQDVMNALDSALHWLEENQQNFPDRRPIESAREIVEGLMNEVRR